MLYMTIEDFYQKAGMCRRMSREEEIVCARQMKGDDPYAREKMIQSYIPMVAALIKRAPAQIRSLSLAVACHQVLEREVDSFDFLQESESFSHRLSWCLRQTIVKHIADR